jgi:hypothetical protein
MHEGLAGPRHGDQQTDRLLPIVGRDDFMEHATNSGPYQARVASILTKSEDHFAVAGTDDLERDESGSGGIVAAHPAQRIGAGILQHQRRPVPVGNLVRLASEGRMGDATVACRTFVD